MRASGFWAIGLFGLVGASGCATARPALNDVVLPEPEWSVPPLLTIEEAVPALETSQRQQIVESARRWLERKARAHDCSSFVRAVLGEAGVEVPVEYAEGDTGSRALFRSSQPVREPRPGDIAVFHNTWDRNRNGRLDDPFSHIAVVEQVEAGRVTLIHRGGSGVSRLKMNLQRPFDRSENGVLRPAGRHPMARAGELFGGFGSLVAD